MSRFVPRSVPVSSLLRLAAVLFLAAFAAVFGAAVAPWLPLVIVVGTYVAGSLLLRGRPTSQAARRVLALGLGFIALLTLPFGFLTHGVLTGSDGPFAGRPYPGTAADLSTRMAIDSVDALGGTLLSYAATPDAPPVLALRTASGEVAWASTLPPESRVSGLQQLRVFPVLWRIRVDCYAVGPDVPAWFYVWRWGGVQKLYLLTG